MSGSAIRACKCQNEFQDSTYGKGMRVHSKTLKGFRCSVCGHEIGETHVAVATTTKKK